MLPRPTEKKKKKKTILYIIPMFHQNISLQMSATLLDYLGTETEKM